MKRMPVIHAVLTLLMCVSAFAVFAAPAKLRLDTPAANAWIGEEQRIQVTLVDTDDRPAAAPRDWPVALTVTDPAGAANRFTITIARGASTQTFPFTPARAGIWEIGASDPQLLDGAVVLAAGVRQSASPPPSEPAFERGENGGTRANGGVELGEILQPPPSPVSAPSSMPQIELRASPRRKLLADGKDVATIYGLLTGEAAAAQDIELRLHNDDGTLAPAAVHIPKGQYSGSARLTSQRPGAVTIEYLGANTNARIVGEARLQVAFGPPITRLALAVSPPTISFLESADIVVRLLDEDGRQLATDEPREVFLTIEGGGAQLEPATLKFPAGSAEQRARLRPTQAGAVTLAAASPDLLTVRSDAQVAWPLVPLLISVVGGAIGGGLAYLQQRKGKKWRIAIGLVTGFLLYWAAVFIGINLIPVAIALNPISALAIAIIGGWMGTKVFTPLMQRLGLST